MDTSSGCCAQEDVHGYEEEQTHGLLLEDGQRWQQLPCAEKRLRDGGKREERKANLIL